MSPDRPTPAAAPAEPEEHAREEPDEHGVMEAAHEVHEHADADTLVKEGDDEAHEHAGEGAREGAGAVPRRRLRLPRAWISRSRRPWAGWSRARLTERLPRPRPSRPGPALIVAGVAALLLFVSAWIRFASFHSSAFDLAFYDQAVWNAAQGHGFTSSFISYPLFGEHFEPALWLFVPFYKLHPTPLWLLGAQSLALGGAVVPLFALARRLTTGRVAPWAFVAAYLLQIAIARATGFDFHTEALAVPFVFLALLGAARGSDWLVVVAGAVPLFCKEDGALVSLGIALLAVLISRRRMAACVLAVLAVAAGAITVFGIMPSYRGGAVSDLFARYSYLGATPGQVLLHLVTEPQVWIHHLVTAPAGPALLGALAAVAFLPLARPLALLACAPALLISLLSDQSYQAGLLLQYGLPSMPLLVGAAVLGWQRMVGADPAALQARVRAWAFALVGSAAATLVVLGPLPDRLGPDQLDVGAIPRSAAVQRVLDRIPPGAEVGATGPLLTHLAERPSIWELPAGVGVRWIAVENYAAVTNDSRAAGYDTAVAGLYAYGYRVVASTPDVTLWYIAPSR